MANPLVMQGGVFQQGALPWWLTYTGGQNPESGNVEYKFFDKNTGKPVTQDNAGNFSYADGSAPNYGNPENATVLGAGGPGLTQIRLADGTVTNATPLTGDTGDYSKLFQGIVPNGGVAQVTGQGAPQTQVVRGSDGQLYSALPSNAHVTAPHPDHDSILGNLVKDFGPIAMAALPFSGLGGALTSQFGDIGGRAILNAGTSLLGGGDPIRGAISGAAGGAINGLDIPAGLKPALSTAASTAITGGNPQSAAMSLLGQGVKSLGMNAGPANVTDAPALPTQDPAQIWPTQSPLYDLNQPLASTYLNAPVSGASQMDMTGFMTPQSYDPSQIWPTSNDYNIYSPNGTPAGNYMDTGSAYGGDPSAAGSVSSGNTIQNFIKGLLGAGASVGGVGGLLGSMGGSSLALPLLGGLLGGLSGGAKPAGTTTSITDIPDWQKPYVTNAFGQAGTALTAGNNAYTSTQPMLTGANNQLTSTINGDYLNSNPYLDATFNNAARGVTNQINSQFTAAGRYGSGAQTSALSDGLNNLATQIYGGNYANERARQVAAAGNAPTYSAGATGAAFAPATDYANIVKSPLGNTQSSPYFTNPLGGAISGLLGGYALSKA